MVVVYSIKSFKNSKNLRNVSDRVHQISSRYVQETVSFKYSLSFCYNHTKHGGSAVMREEQERCWADTVFSARRQGWKMEDYEGGSAASDRWSY